MARASARDALAAGCAGRQLAPGPASIPPRSASMRYWPAEPRASRWTQECLLALAPDKLDHVLLLSDLQVFRLAHLSMMICASLVIWSGLHVQIPPKVTFAPDQACTYVATSPALCGYFPLGKTSDDGGRAIGAGTQPLSSSRRGNYCAAHAPTNAAAIICDRSVKQDAVQ
jgi:hypothetical protein